MAVRQPVPDGKVAVPASRPFAATARVPALANRIVAVAVPADAIANVRTRRAPAVPKPVT